MRTLLVIASVCGLSLPLEAQFLVPDQQYRCPLGDQCATPSSLPSFEERQSPKGHAYTINYVEFKDNGDLWNRKELTDALRQIKNARDGGKQKPLVVVYIHGWQNNADENSGDVRSFRDTLLARLADEYAPSEPGKPPQVVGVYLAWRGLTFTVEPFKHIFSYWPRRGVARHVGQTGMLDALRQIKDVVAENRQDYFLVLAGHSFGARVLENAADGVSKAHPGFMMLYRAQIQKAPQPAEQLDGILPANTDQALRARPPADLIFYVNAATASTVTRKTLRGLRSDCKEQPGSAICSADPFYLAVTSHADWATGFIMPVANIFWPALDSDGLIHKFSAADTPWMHTHHDPVLVDSCPHTPSSVCFTAPHDGSSAVYSVNRLDNAFQIPGKKNAPFWIFNVDANVMDSHGDIWNPTVTDLVTNVIKNNQTFVALELTAMLATQ